MMVLDVHLGQQQKFVQLLEKAGRRLVDGSDDRPPALRQLPQQLHQVHGARTVQPCSHEQLLSGNGEHS